LRKRLEIINQPTEKIADEFERYHNFMNEQYPGFPREIEITHDGRRYKFETILYVIRHTFWRPRDVLFYMAELLARLEVCRKRKRPFSAEIIKACVSSCTYEIIKSEFIGEFRSICPNIESVIRSFENCKQVLTFDEVGRVLFRIEIGFVYLTHNYDTVVDKIKFLFGMGFLGFELDEKAKRQFRMDTSEVFSFSEGDRIIDIANDSEFQSFRYIIHPVFCEFLRLETTQHELVLRYAPEYLRHNDLQDRR
jgi:hypothetical protein